MKGFHLSLRSLMGVIAGIALVLAVLLHPTPLMASLAWTGTLTILIVAALVAVLDPRRIFFVGFAVVGLIFAAFAALPDIHNESPLLTSRSCTYFYLWSRDGTPALAAQFYLHGYSSLLFPTGDEAVRFLALLRIFDSFAALLHGTAGGVLALYLHPRLRRGSERTSQP